MNTVELVTGGKRHSSRVQRTYFSEWLEMRPVLTHCAKLTTHYCGLNHWKYKRVVLGLACGNRDGGLIASQNNTTECSAMVFRIFFKLVLLSMMSDSLYYILIRTYRLPPCPIARHKILVSTLIVLIMDLLSSKIHLVCKIQISQLIVQHNACIIKMDIVHWIFPGSVISLWYFSIE